MADALPRARIVGIDDSDATLAAAAEAMDPRRTQLRRGRLEDPLPAGPFDLVMSMLAVHHLDGPGKADLFAQVARVLDRSGRFVLGDLVIPADPRDVVTEIDGVMDAPSPLSDQLEWLRSVGLDPEVHWAHGTSLSSSPTATASLEPLASPHSPNPDRSSRLRPR